MVGGPVVGGMARDRALSVARLGHAVFRRLGELTVPSFCFINGVALGGGLEVALHCTYRTLSAGAGMVALPECFLGLVPGWGGTYLLPRLIGPARAVKVIIENPLSQNKMLSGPEAFELGIADAMFAPADFLEESLRWAASVLTGAVTVSRPASLDALSPAEALPPGGGQAGRGVGRRRRGGAVLHRRQAARRRARAVPGT